MSGGGGSSSDGGGGGNQHASAKAAMTGNAAYSGSTKPSQPPGGGATSRGSGRDVSHTPDRISRIAGGQEPGYRAQDSQPFGLSKEEAYRQGKITVDQRDADAVLTEQHERDVTRDLSFGEHWANRPDSIKWSPTLSLLYAGGKNIGDFASKKGFQGYNEAGLRTGNFFGGSTFGGDGNNNTGGGDGERQRMNVIAPHAPYIVSGITKPPTSPAQNWYQGLGNSSTNSTAFNLATEFAAAKTKQAAILGNSSAVGKLAANQTPYFDFLQKHSLTKGIL